MAMVVTEHIEGHYEVTLMEPETSWLALLSGKMLCDEMSVLSLALDRGLVELMGMFGRPEQTKEKGAQSNGR